MSHDESLNQPSRDEDNQPTPTVRLRNPSDLIQAVPFLLRHGQLADDLVLFATRQGRHVFVMRAELGILAEGILWPSAHPALAATTPDRIHLILYPPAPVTDDTLRTLHAQARNAAMTAPDGVQMGWITTTSQKRWWLHDVETAAPHGPGELVQGDPVTSLKFQVLQGFPAASRDAIVASTAPHAQPVLDAVAHAISHLPAQPARESVRAAVHAALDRRARRPIEWSIREAAEVLDALTDASVRDEMIIHRSDDDHMCSAWSSLLPYAPPGWVAPVATVAAISAYQRGDSVFARAALERAQEANPGYQLARIFTGLMDAAYSPSQIKADLAERRRMTANRPHDTN
ncbi:DUF4192 domain-containing protein [Kineosporia sp. J2-2]|uniref:DUF4192 domain-containing protein n=1 Tax=Kineosporia corallincola TaxID=2835133 RepID=A0ABS5TTP0_9ACTN|nr:DUF4192 domain-containing protein [Kineosporia corallincola]MBT0774164.1 DUF4192 domain-containing protein [Kineosporia corallincola]